MRLYLYYNILIINLIERLRIIALHNRLLRLMCIGVLALFFISPIDARNLSTHYIVAFDQAIPLYRNEYLNPKILRTIDSVLERNDFKYGEDYISVVGYALENNPSMERFVRPYKDVKGNDILWKKYKYALSGNLNNWPNGQPILNLAEGSPSSMQSLAKPYIIMETKEKDDSMKIADRTMLLLVTDEKVNGPDDNYRQEWDRVKGISGSNLGNYSKIESGVFNTMRKFNEEYKFERINIKYWGGDREEIPLSPDKAYKIVPYEVVPVEKPSIHAVTDLPSPLPIQRVRGGFKVKTDASSINHKYKIKDIILRGKNGEILGRSENGSFDFVIPSNKISAGDTVDIQMSLLLKDGFYDSTIISPDNERYKSGMTNRQVVKLQDEAKVMGIFPLYDIFWWWFPNDVLYAVLIWDLIIVLIFVALIMYLIKRFSAYTPSSDKVSLGPVKSCLKIKK